MAEGGMRPSKINITQNRVGVYAVEAKKNWTTPLNYAIAVPLLNNGLFYQFVAELRSPTETVKHNKSMHDDHVLDSTQTRIVAFRVYVSDFRDWRAGDGFYARHHWDVHLEYHPSGDHGEDPGSELNALNFVDRVKEVNDMLRSLEVPLSTKDS